MGNILSNLGLYLARPVITDLNLQIMALNDGNTDLRLMMADLEGVNHKQKLEIAKLKRRIIKLTKKDQK